MPYLADVYSADLNYNLEEVMRKDFKPVLALDTEEDLDKEVYIDLKHGEFTNKTKRAREVQERKRALKDKRDYDDE